MSWFSKPVADDDEEDRDKMEEFLLKMKDGLSR